ncbi:MAG: SDR family NAD(P)-dependent oxidoreductase [Candidatus Atribacteria bacterium]|nr:SDR family NAD(P)-dependent oxidoreductase [Candidatus Atribacteria bacterium]
MDLGLKDKVACITGGSMGIGYAVAEGLAKEGVQVAICARNEERVRKAADDIRQKYGVKTLGYSVDVTKMESLERFVQEIQKVFGGVDILINNAGTGSAEKIMDAPDDKWQYYWDLHVMAAIRMSRALVPAMRKRGGGVILNTSSICSRSPLDYEPIYNVTKAALVMFSKCLANELVHDNIRVNCINPGLVMTPDWKKTATILSKELGITWEEYLDRVAKEKAPIGRFSSPEEMANFYVFLCSPRASYCIGSSYYVDGGWLSVTI